MAGTATVVGSGNIHSPAPIDHATSSKPLPRTSYSWLLTIPWACWSLFTVLLTELGIHQSQQRTVLSEHMPAKFRDDGKARGGTLRAPSLSRIDRPHFSPAFVELPAAGKGCTVRKTTVVQTSIVLRSEASPTQEICYETLGSLALCTAAPLCCIFGCASLYRVSPVRLLACVKSL